MSIVMPSAVSSDLLGILRHIDALAHLPEAPSLKRLIDYLRPTLAPDDEDYSTQIADKMGELIEILNHQPALGAGLAAFILTLTAKYRQVTLYTDTGIVSDHSFFASLNRLIGHRFLPLLPEEDSVVELINFLFDKKQDSQWLENIDKDAWNKLIELICVDDRHLHLVASAKNNILNAIIILSYRIAGVGLHSEMMQNYPQMLNYSASFVAQNQEAVVFVDEYRRLHKLDEQTDFMPEIDVDTAPLMVMIEQCQEIVITIKKRVYKTGISIRLTNALVRLEQSLLRMQVLITLVADDKQNRDKALIELIQTLVSDAHSRYSIGFLIENNTRLLSKKVTENASRVGEHYISTDKTGYQKMYQKAAIGGFLIAFMASIKILASYWTLAPIGRAFINSMIYGLGFVAIHIIGGTVATKQPAMTAAAIASTLSDAKGKKVQQLTKLSELIVDIMRTQFIAIIGNISIAMPVALVISLSFIYFYGAPIVDDIKAAKLLHELDPIASLSLPHAAIAGVFLFVSGLISGYYDNLAAYNKIGERLARHWLLVRLLPAKWLQKIADFTAHNLGAVMGNFIFGVFLGSTATLGLILGLPIDIRHIAFASANFIHGVVNLSPENLSIGLVVWSFLGMLLIGVVNLMVSFSLALIVALRSKDVQFLDWKKLGGLIFSHLRARPLDFIWPPREPVTYSKIGADGRMIVEAETHKTYADNYFNRKKPPKNQAPAEAPSDIVEAIKAYHQDDTAHETATKSALEKPKTPPKLPD